MAAGEDQEEAYEEAVTCCGCVTVRTPEGAGCTCNVYGLPRLLQRLHDGRRNPAIPTFDVVNSLFHAALFRLPSINALEGDLRETDFQRLIGRKPEQDVKVFSAEVISNVLDQLELGGLRDGIDGWEPFASYHRHCPHCLVRKIKSKNPESGELEERKQYYHRYVVAMLLGPVIDFTLAIEPVRNDEACRDASSIRSTKPTAPLSTPSSSMPCMPTDR